MTNGVGRKMVATSWWVWCAWSEREGTSRFVYGCAARCFRAPDWRPEPEQVDVQGAKLFFRQATVDVGTFKRFEDRLKAGSIELGIFFGEVLPHVAVKDTRSVLQSGLGQTASRVSSSYTLPDIASLMEDVERRLPTSLALLQERLGLPFSTTHATRLGNFELFDLNPWLDTSQPFLIEGERPGKIVGPQAYRICREPEFADVEHKAHVVGRVNGDVLLDRLFTLKEKELIHKFDTEERLDEIEFRLFNSDGDTLLHFERNNFMNRIGFVLSPTHRQVSIQDGLSTRAKQGGKAVASQASIVRSHSSLRSLVGAPEAGSWRKFAEDMAHAVALHSPSASEDKWFPRGVEGEVGAIAHLDRILDGGSVRRAVLVDPWFGVDALSQFVLRLASVDVEITILTSWVDTDPDTNTALDPASPTRRLKDTLEQIRLFINPKLTLINLVDGKDQAFHDRYLLTYPHEGLSKAFLLSNSLNKAGKNWPFSMSLMAPDVARDIRLYIEGLCEGKDTARQKPLTVNFRWPINV